MKTLLPTEDTLTNKISYYHVMLLLVTLPFDQFFSHIVFISFTLHTLFNLKKDKLNKVFTLRNGILQAVFFVTLISLSYTKYPALAGIDITRQLVILLFPLTFSLSSFNFNKYRDNLLLIFSLMCVAIIIYLYLFAFYIIHYFKFPLKAIFFDLFINHKFSAPINMHATFFSLQVAVALFFVLSQLFKPQVARNKYWYWAAAIILFAGLVQLGSKAVLGVVFIGVIAAIPYFVVRVQNRLKYVLIAGLLTIVIGAGALSINSFKERYITDLKADLSDQTAYESVEPRLVRWDAAMAVAKKHPIIGYGAGAELDILGNEYFKDKLYISYLHRLNAHNQYITFVLATGIIGLLVYLATLLFGFKTAWERHDMLFFIFMLLIVVVSLSESLLNAEKGIYFYSLFFSFFIFSGNNIAKKIL